MFWNKKPKESLTEQEEKVKKFKRKELRDPMILFFIVFAITLIGISEYLQNELPAGSYLVAIIPLWSMVIILVLISLSKITRYTIKVYFESLKPKDQ